MALEKIDIDTLDPAATIVVATGNAHKLTEIEAILGKVMPEVRFVALGQLGDFEDPEENGTTFLENAIIKAQAAVEETRFMSVVALIDTDGLVTYGEGACEGVIAHEGRGDHGFGYDPLFLPVDTPGKTMAELTADEKNAVSHRFHALEHLSAKLTGEE